MSNTKPFEADAPKQIDPINDGVHKLRQQHKLNAEAHRTAFEQRAATMWERAEQERRTSWISKYREDNYVPLPYPWKDLSKEDQYRISLPSDTRIDALAAVKLHDQMLYCFLARTPERKATVEQIQTWFAPYLPVTGEMSVTEDIQTGGARHTITHAANLSKPLADLLARTWLVKCKFGKVTWNPGEGFEPSEY
jgi:hypothetical protein